MNKLLVQQIESLIDNNGLGNVLLALEEVCDAKADHLEHSWQDGVSAAWWSNASYWVKNAYDMAFDREIQGAPKADAE
jgi:hypothetical protein